MQTHEAGLEALADPTRRRIFEALGEAPHSVGDLAERMPVSRPAVSQHLRVLKDAGLVTAKASGTRRIYAVDTAGVAALRTYFDRFWSAALADFAVAVTQSAADVPAGPDRRDPALVDPALVDPAPVDPAPVDPAPATTRPDPVLPGTTDTAGGTSAAVDPKELP